MTKSPPTIFIIEDEAPIRRFLYTTLTNHLRASVQRFTTLMALNR